MAHIVTILHADGKKSVQEFPKRPELKQLQGFVGGLIELVPHWNKWEGRKAEVWCNEECRLESLPLNSTATKEWLAVLGPGPFSYEPQLFGDVAIVQTKPK